MPRSKLKRQLTPFSTQEQGPDEQNTAKNTLHELTHLTRATVAAPTLRAVRSRATDRRSAGRSPPDTNRWSDDGTRKPPPSAPRPPRAATPTLRCAPAPATRVDDLSHDKRPCAHPRCRCGPCPNVLKTARRKRASARCRPAAENARAVSWQRCLYPRAMLEARSSCSPPRSRYSSDEGRRVVRMPTNNGLPYLHPNSIHANRGLEARITMFSSEII